ncbi:Plant intracellular Ras-group-related LRR protein 7 [Dichanthelium oligosanthes]|uniref:Plant intracellular Ras-group-related LRR protein 7 n=1 Tax=Dichanthelium oligosanthes TaxID=888268 RepID=A0A1E5W8K2_9POAL|nr:Plant intracellular Ras-group-related LRR protein 7 [Dichanthelium oligosanthes]
MGCCSSRSSDSPASRAARWRSTGIVALRDARLKEVPIEVLQVGNSLRTLDLTNNKLVEIPQDIGGLVNMQRLVLAGNLIENIPANIGYLRNLKILTLDRNRISILPEELGSLSNLQQLSISQNSLLCLPKSVGDLHNLPQNILKDCKALQNISLHDNPITMDDFRQMDGFNEFEARRRKKFDKQIDSRVMMGSMALDEGVDFH